GPQQVLFANGNRLDIASAGDLFLQRVDGVPRLVARVSREEYVARVLEREASAQPKEAARALAVTIRTYLLQNAAPRGEFLAIDDSSQRQRVGALAGRGATRWRWLLSSMARHSPRGAAVCNRSVRMVTASGRAASFGFAQASRSSARATYVSRETRATRRGTP
ncbi:SpoIID/LytB domain-containing protein, partial [Pseudomonas aeruginosa]